MHHHPIDAVSFLGTLPWIRHAQSRPIHDSPHFHEWNTVGSDRPYHYLGSGAFFVRLGDSFANATYKLMETRK